MTTDPIGETTTETAHALLWRHGLPEDVIDGALCLHAQELAAVQRTEMRAPGRSYDASRWNRCVGMTADLIDPTTDAEPAAVPMSAAAPEARLDLDIPRLHFDTPDQTELRDRIRRAICEAEGFDWDPDWLETDEYGGQADAVLAVLPPFVDRTAEIEALHEEHKASLRRADEINNQLMEEVQRYAAGTERPVLWSVYNEMHLRADNAEARAAAMERAMESTAADALKHRGCHRDLMGQCLRAERAEAAIGRVLKFAASLDEIGRNLAGPEAVHPVAAHLRHLLETPADEAAVLPPPADQVAVPAELKAIVDRAAGRDHGADGAVMACLAEVLAVHRAMLRGETPTADRAAEAPEPATRARRGDAFEQWLKAQRDKYDRTDQREESSEFWHEFDRALDEYRLHADTGTPLSEHVCEGRTVGDCEHLEQPETVAYFHPDVPNVLLCRTCGDRPGLDVTPLASENLPNGGICTRCGVDVLIPQPAVQTEEATPCGPAPDQCDAEAGEPCANHEREQAHSEGEHCFCGPECAR